MDTTPLPADFKEFLRLLNSHGVEYLVVGGYAVGFHGYPRATADLDIWVPIDRGNADKLTRALREFGFGMPELSPELFLEPERVVRMGVPPMRIEILTSISGVEFRDCYARKESTLVDDLQIPFLALEDLKANKRAAGRHQDLSDLEHLP